MLEKGLASTIAAGWSLMTKIKCLDTFELSIALSRLHGKQKLGPEAEAIFSVAHQTKQQQFLKNSRRCSIEEQQGQVQGLQCAHNTTQPDLTKPLVSRSPASSTKVVAYRAVADIMATLCERSDAQDRAWKIWTVGWGVRLLARAARWLLWPLWS